MTASEFPSPSSQNSSCVSRWKKRKPRMRKNPTSEMKIGGMHSRPTYWAICGTGTWVAALVMLTPMNMLANGTDQEK